MQSCLPYQYIYIYIYKCGSSKDEDELECGICLETFKLGKFVQLELWCSRIGILYRLLGVVDDSAK